MWRWPMCDPLSGGHDDGTVAERNTQEVVTAWVRALDMNDDEAADFEQWYRKKHT